MLSYTGIIIEESLQNTDVLKALTITSTTVEPVTKEHQTPWLSQWTMHTIEVLPEEVENISHQLSTALEPKHGWYIDYRNEKFHYVIFYNKVFKLDRTKKSDYDEMVAYGLSIGTPDYQLPNFSDLPIDVLEPFLKKANLNTYANEQVKKAPSLRPGSHDYHFEDGELAYHDTYFGGTKFMGEEIVYKVGKPAWGMNYYGFALDSNISEKVFDAILRPALMSGSGNNIPVRGPKEFIKGDWKYTFVTDGTLSNFTGVEEILKNKEVVYRLHCHGGFIE